MQDLFFRCKDTLTRYRPLPGQCPSPGNAILGDAFFSSRLCWVKVLRPLFSLLWSGRFFKGKRGKSSPVFWQQRDISSMISRTFVAFSPLKSVFCAYHHSVELSKQSRRCMFVQRVEIPLNHDRKYFGLSPYPFFSGWLGWFLLWSTDSNKPFF